MKQVLVVLTSTFPAGTKDGFVAGELPYLCRAFDQVMLFAVNAVGSLPVLPAALPANCTAWLPNRRSGARARLRDVVYALRTFWHADADFRAEYRQGPSTLRQKIYLRYFEGRAEQAAADIRGILKDLVPDGAEVTLYSYWLYIACRAMTKVGDGLRQLNPDRKIRQFSRAHGYDLYEEAEGWGYLPFRGAFLQQLDGIFPCSQNGVEHLSKARPDIVDGRAPVFVSRLGIAAPEATAAAVSAADRELLDERIRLVRQMQADAADAGETVFEIVTCAWIRPVKRLDLLVDALSLLRRQTGFRWIWTHFGDGASSADFEGLRRLAAEKLSFMTVQFMGSTPKPVILYYYLNARPDCFVNCSSSEGVPVSVMEAMGCCMPVLATDVGGTWEITGSDLCGILWPEDVSPARMASDLLGLAGRLPEERAELGFAARSRYQLLCQAEINYTGFAAVLSGELPPQPVPFDGAPVRWPSAGTGVSVSDVMAGWAPADPMPMDPMPAQPADESKSAAEPAGAPSAACSDDSSGRPIVHVIGECAAAGAEMFVRNLALALAGRSERPVEVWTLYRAVDIHPGDTARAETETQFINELTAAGIRVRQVGKRPGGDYRRTHRVLRAYLKDVRPAVVHSHLEEVSFHVCLACLGTGIPVVQTLHSAKIRRVKLLKYFFRFCCAALICISDQIEAEAAELVPRRLCIPIPNGIPTGRFRDPDRDPNRPVRRLIAVGRLAAVKNHRMMIEAMAILKARCDAAGIPCPELFIYGEGELRAELTAAITALSLEGRVHLPGVSSDMPARLKESDVYLMSSDVEGMSIALLEAMSAGLPCVLTAVSGVRDLAADGVSARIVPAGDAVAMASAVFDIITNLDLRKRLGTGALAAALPYDISRCADRHLALYGALTADPGR